MRTWLGLIVIVVTGCQTLLALDADDGGDASVVDGGAITDAASDAVRNDSALDAGIVRDGNTCPPSGPGPCRDDGGFVWNGRCYFFVEPSQNVYDNQAAATGQCLAQDASLVTITCKDELAIVLGNLQNNAWTGATLVGSTFEWPAQEPWLGPPLSGDAAANGCVWLDRNSSKLLAVDCTARSASTLCEQGPLAR